MKILKMYTSNINDRFMDEVIETLKDGGIIIYPTDTLYAIGCNALNNNAIERICKIKGINSQRTNLSIVCSDISQASQYARIDNRAFQLLRENLPGAFTFILPTASTLPKAFKGRKAVGIRVPDNVIAREIASRLGNPILTTSIEWDDDPEDGCNPQAIAMKYEDIVDIVIDGGYGELTPSTVVDCLDSSSPEITREGKGIFN
ncbi:MAG: threonylcarbamoyl-AMP synthase [Muribaculaceae bacterium]|nr:threonylcarbamoyl-AMP synthase [Muribaculaceae bacterium]MBQ7855323.1 threonylcarbamoyl-AMP synthase [Muribaculaceae bacterium]